MEKITKVQTSKTFLPYGIKKHDYNYSLQPTHILKIFLTLTIFQFDDHKNEFDSEQQATNLQLLSSSKTSPITCTISNPINFAQKQSLIEIYIFFYDYTQQLQKNFLYINIYLQKYPKKSFSLELLQNSKIPTNIQKFNHHPKPSNYYLKHHQNPFFFQIYNAKHYFFKQ
eukprot:TRINITY_DN9819_c0_g1_i7.p2 TRINITY_DN9819_c0_g1~~TRINITY_DN9819_c0_g1_i7.p2  ORF type:complete len:190 (+),score=-0.02 TRINITY_DN9819_c0_g1_i7:62-571(+)